MSAAAHKQLWGVVEGAVNDAFHKHSDYLTHKGRKSAKSSIIKRVTGTVLSFALQEAKRQRELAATADGLTSDQQQATGDTTSDAAGGVCDVIRTHSNAHVNARCYQAVRRALFPVGARAVRKDATRFKRALSATTTKLRNTVARASVRSIPVRG